MNKESTTNKKLEIALWAAQILLGAMLLWAAFMKITFPSEKLGSMWPWTIEHPNLVIITGMLDGLAGLGLILPRILNLAPRLTFYAALGIVLLMIVAIVFHFSRNEGSVTGFNFMVLSISAFIAFFRK